MNLIEYILDEWSYRVPNGMPNPKNPYHLLKLQEKPALIPHTELADERQWVSSIWKHFMGESN